MKQTKNCKHEWIFLKEGKKYRDSFEEASYREMFFYCKNCAEIKTKRIYL
jgi:hypothetical protein